MRKKQNTYTILSRKNNNSIVRDVEFESVENFKCLVVELYVSGSNHKEIQNGINSANKCISGLRTILKSKLILYKVMDTSVALYACETWAATKTDERNLARFERIDDELFEPRGNRRTGEYERRKNDEVVRGFRHNSYYEKQKDYSWAGHVWRGGEPDNWPSGSRRVKDHSAVRDKGG